MANTRINLGLQGGGAHGAFTWGVLDRLLEDETLEIAAISGTSAGALNGAALKAGWVKDGRDGARAKLDAVWAEMGALPDNIWPTWLMGAQPEPQMISRAIESNPFFIWSDMVGRVTSPYGWGPLYRNPLEEVVSSFAFDGMDNDVGPELFVGATCVRDGKVRVFSGKSLSTKAILASACLPTLFQAIEIECPLTGVVEAFWDGGYTGNPPLFPLFENRLPDDILVVNINPLERNKLPRMPAEIQNRINEISFNSSLLREMRAIHFVQRLISAGRIEEGAMKGVRLHMIADDALMNELSVATKTLAVPTLLTQLKAAGRRAAGTFLAAHRDDLGQNQTVDLKAMFG